MHTRCSVRYGLTWPEPPRRSQWLAQGLVALVLLCGGMPSAQAHLMVAQKGTLNLQGQGAYLVMSLPASAFSGIDDDGDGKVSAIELSRHQSGIASAVQRGITLHDAQGALPLQGLMLSCAPPDDAPDAPSAHLVVMGRFALAAQSQPLRLGVALFGSTPESQTVQVKVTRGDEAQWLVLTPDHPVRAVFASAWETMADFALLGAAHIATGVDHLLFLLVVLACGWGWRHVVLSLSCFTVGHALTLLASVGGLLTVPAAVVEPAIAATIVGMAVFDGRMRQQRRQPTAWIRLLLVFACSLIHGLGLGSSLIELGLDTRHRLLSLAGFNAGIELGQLAIVALGGALALGVQRYWGVAAYQYLMRAAHPLAIAAGTVWFFQRLA